MSIGSIYIITATEVNHFFTGSAIGDYFIAAAATALDANNKVQEVTWSTINTVANLGFQEGRYWYTTATLDDPDMLGGVLFSDNTGNNELRWSLSRATSTVVVVKIVAGTPTVLINTAISYVAGKKICVVYDKEQGGITCFYNNAIVGTFQAYVPGAGMTWGGAFSTGDATVDDLDFGPFQLDIELFPSYDFQSDFSKVNVSASDADSFTTSNTGGVYLNACSAGSLYKTKATMTTSASSVVACLTDATVTGIVQSIAANTYGYVIANSTYKYLYIRNADAGTTDVTALTLRKVN